MPKYKLEYILETTHMIIIEADDEHTASELGNDIDIADWKETGCNTLEYMVTDITEEENK